MDNRNFVICILIVLFHSGGAQSPGGFIGIMSEDDQYAPSASDIIEAGNITADIEDPVMRKIIELYILYCPNQSMCNKDYWRDMEMVRGRISCCEQCSCADECGSYGNCCPTLLSSSVNNITNQIELTAARNTRQWNVMFTCTDPQVLPFPSLFNAPTNYFMVDRCPEHLSAADELVGLCKNHDFKEADSISADSPVTSSVSDITYKNMYCAKCHGETTGNLTSWDLQLQCKSPLKDYSLEEIKRSIFDLSQCNLIYDPSNIWSRLRECPRHYVSRCNATGHWTQYDAVIEVACSAVVAPFGHEDTFYRNIFCYICNTGQMERYPMMCVMKNPDMTGVIEFTSFTALLDFSPIDDERLDEPDVGTCDTGEKYDYFQDVCRPILCPDHLTLDRKDLTCTEPFELLAVMKYEMHIKFTPVNPVSQSCTVCADMSIAIIKKNVVEFFYKWLMKSWCEVTAWYVTGGIGSEDDILFFVVDIVFIMYEYHDFTDIFEHFLSFASHNVEFFDIVFGNLSFATSFMERQNYLVKYNLEFVQVHEFDFGLKINGTLPDMAFSLCKSPDTPVTSIESINLCPQISMRANDTTGFCNSTFLFLEDLNITFVETEFRCRNGTYTICAEKYFLRTDMMNDTLDNLEVNKEISTIDGFLSLICTCISAFSLLLTIATYSLFRELRTLPGKNNMGLSITLLLAQCLYAFSSRLRDMETLCIISGMLTHYFWLAAVFWMNVCCIHMFRVFRSVDKLQVVTNPTRSLSIYIIYTILCPAIAICFNIALSSVTSGGNSLGYGGNICYITSRSMVLYTFAIPLGLVLVINILLFGVATWKLSRIENIKTTSGQKRNNLTIFAKLSCLTGASWVFGFLYVFTKFGIFSHVFIFLTAGQGFSIMIAFVFNERVCGLYSSLCCRRKSKPGKSTSPSHKRRTNLTELSSSASTQM